MPCYSPLTGYRSKDLTATGKRGIVFNRNASLSGSPVPIPCGQCIGCRLERSRQWAVRCMHEKLSHDKSSFLTLTYDNDHLPRDMSLNKRDLQLFFKRAREAFGKFRYYACGEYGSETRRPHYHAIMFGLDFPDARFYKASPTGDRWYRSDQLDKVWGAGFCTIGAVTFNSASYVASYVVDKITGPKAAEYYSYVDADGLVHSRLPEFTVMSRRPGIGKAAYDLYGNHWYNRDSCVVNGKAVTPPRYYDVMFEAVDSAKLARIKAKRRRKALRKVLAEKAFESRAVDALPRRVVTEAVAYARRNEKVKKL